MSISNTSSSGIGFSGLLTIAFIVLKLCKVIAWSWWWVLSPIWISAGIVLIIIIIYGLFLWRESIDEKRRIASGMNKWAWDIRKNKNNLGESKKPVYKSKWEQKVDDMQKRKREDGSVST